MTSVSLPADTVQGDGSHQEASAMRLTRLRDSVSGLGRGRRLAVNTEQLLLISGGVLIPLGIVLIFLGWWGAAHTPRMFEQIPYAISGGILGGALVIAGGFFYFGYWLTKLVYEGRQQAADFTAALNQLEARLSAELEAPVAPSARGNRRRAPASEAAPTGVATLVATATGTMLHKADCPVVLGKEGLRRVAADTPGLKPCRICEPLS